MTLPSCISISCPWMSFRGLVLSMVAAAREKHDGKIMLIRAIIMGRNIVGLLLLLLLNDFWKYKVWTAVFKTSAVEVHGVQKFAKKCNIWRCCPICLKKAKTRYFLEWSDPNGLKEGLAAWRKNYDFSPLFLHYFPFLAYWTLEVFYVRMYVLWDNKNKRSQLSLACNNI